MTASHRKTWEPRCRGFPCWLELLQAGPYRSAAGRAELRPVLPERCKP